jgi:hypothetical protein
MTIGEGGFYAVDRVESGRAVLICDAGEEYVISLAELPGGTREGVVLQVTNDGNGKPIWSTARIDEVEAARRKREVEDILENLRRTDPGRDVQL